MNDLTKVYQLRLMKLLGYAGSPNRITTFKIQEKINRFRKNL